MSDLIEAWGDTVDRTEYLYDDDPAWFGQLGALGSTVTSIADRKDGSFRPVYETEQDLAAQRAIARGLGAITRIHDGALDALANYTFGQGFEFRAITKRHELRDSAADIVDRVQQIIDGFLDAAKFAGDLDREIHARSRMDGESLVKLRKNARGDIVPQIIEPEQLQEPLNSREVEEFEGLCYSIDDPPLNWKFGVATDAEDSSCVVGWNLITGERADEWEFLPVALGEFFKRNTTRNAKRGVSDLYGIFSDLKNEARLTRNSVLGAAVQSAIAWIRQFPPGTSSSSAATIGNSAAVSSVTLPKKLGGTQERNALKYSAGSILNVPAGLEYKPGPMGAERNAGFDLIGQRALKRIGQRWNMPESMISGDASNANYASSLVAEAPFVKARQADQQWYGQRFVSMLWKVVAMHWQAGRFDRWSVTMEQLRAHIEIAVNYPAVESRDPLKIAQTARVLEAMGVISPRTIATQQGLDLDEEVRQGAKKPEPPPSPMGGVDGPGPMGGGIPNGKQKPNDDALNAAVQSALESVRSDPEARAILQQLQEGWNEEDHPREPAGSADGGEFSEKGGGSGGNSAGDGIGGKVAALFDKGAEASIHAKEKFRKATGMGRGRSGEGDGGTKAAKPNPIAPKPATPKKKPLPKKLTIQTAGKLLAAKGYTLKGGAGYDLKTKTAWYYVADRNGTTKKITAGQITDLLQESWNEEDHPREAAGESDGGQFAPKDGGGKATAIIHAAKSIEFGDELVVGDEISSRDYDGIENRLSDEARKDMEQSIEDQMEEAIDREIEDYDPSEHLDNEQISTDAGWSIDDVKDKAIEAIPDGTTLGEEVESWWQETPSHRGHGPEGIDSLRDRIEKVYDTEEPEVAQFLSRLDELRSSAESDFSEHRERHEQQLIDSARDDIRNNLSEKEMRVDWLRDYVANNPDILSGSRKTGKWGKSHDGSDGFAFDISSGQSFNIEVFDAKVGSFDSKSLVFSDSDGSYKVTGDVGPRGAAEVFRNVTHATVAYTLKKSPKTLHFSAAEKSRQKLYDRLVRSSAEANPDYAAVAISGDEKTPKNYFLVKRDHMTEFKKKLAESGVDTKTETITESSRLRMEILKPESNPDWFDEKGWAEDTEKEKK